MAIMNARRRPSPLVIALEAMTFFRNDARAACADHDPEIWFSDSGHIQEAIDTCSSCPLLAGCREWGVEHREHGIWGGLTEQRRTRIRHEREAA